MAWLLPLPRWPRQRDSAALWRWIGRAGTRAAASCRDADWRRDPLSHPALQGMSQRQLGDLPFDPYAVDPD